MFAKCSPQKLQMALRTASTRETRYRMPVGSTPLSIACHSKAAECAAHLIEGGADVTLADANGLTALHVACLNGMVRYTRLTAKRCKPFPDGCAPDAERNCAAADWRRRERVVSELARVHSSECHVSAIASARAVLTFCCSVIVGAGRFLKLQQYACSANQANA